MNKLTIGIAAVTCVAAGAAVAQSPAWPKQDADNDGVVTRAEAQTHSAAMFARLDANKDGSLAPDDREAFAKERRTKAFDQMDANKNGQISREEFVSFKREDHRGDGDRMSRGYHKGHMGRDGSGLGKRADTNNDGKVSEAEFTAASLTRFDRLDTNKDGKVTAEERKAQQQTRHGRMHDMTAKPAQ